MTSKHFYLTVSLFFFISLFVSCGNDKGISVTKIAGAKVINMGMNGVELEIDVKIKNLNPYSFTVYPSDFSVKLNNTDLGTASIKEKIRVKARSEDEHKLIVKSELSGFLSGGIVSLFSLAQKKSLNISLKGEIKAGSLFYKKNIPVDLKEDISLMQ